MTPPFAAAPFSRYAGGSKEGTDMTSTLIRSRVRSVLTTPAAIPQTGPRLKTNLDTDLLKLIAVTAMLIDHIGGVFFRRWACSAGSAGWPFPSSATA